MSANNRILVGFIAVAAFAVGAIINSARVSSTVDTDSLLHAKLISYVGSDAVGSNGSVGEQLGKLTLVNFWASWCAPCRDEMPIFEAMYRRDNKRGFSIVGVAIDNPDNTRAMLDSMNISYPILYAEKTGMQLMDATGNPQGLLPYSLLLDQQGKVLDQVLGRISEQQIADWIDTHL